MVLIVPVLPFSGRVNFSFIKPTPLIFCPINIEVDSSDKIINKCLLCLKIIARNLSQILYMSQYGGGFMS